MSDGTLLAFGCAVTFIALAGFYSYLLDYVGARARSSDAETQRENAEVEVKNVA